MARLTEPQRILLIRPSALGDVCRSVPVLASLRAWRPQARIDWLVRDSFAEAVSAHPALSGVALFPRAALRRWWTSARGARSAAAFLSGLRRERYDFVLDCQGLARSGLFALATGGARRVGYADAREMGWLGLTERLRVDPGLHAVDRMLALVRAAGVPVVRDMRLYAPAPAREALDERLRGRRYAVLAPTSVWPAKRWPIARFSALASALLEGGGVERVALVGGPGEREQCGEAIALAERDPRVVDLIGSTSVGGLMAVIERAALVVANDSAAVHMAVGFDRPLVALYGPTLVERVGPYGRDRDVIQRLREGDRIDHKNPSAVALMERIGVEEVVEAASERLRSGAA